MSFDFSKIAELSTARGELVKLTNSAGRVIWAAQSSEPIILEVEKITSDTYAGEKLYEGESFILLDIYPKTNGTVKVTYGGLTKTITDTSGAVAPNAQQVYFGTFNGVSDEIETPASGELMIEGNYRTFGVGSFTNTSDSKATTSIGYSSCITAINDWGGVTALPASALINCPLTSISVPTTITQFDAYAFSGCTSLSAVHISSIEAWCNINMSTITSNPLYVSAAGLYLNGAIIENVTVPTDMTGRNTFAGYDFITTAVFADGTSVVASGIFDGCSNLVLAALPSSITTICDKAFRGIKDIGFSEFPEGLVSIGESAFQVNLSISSDSYVGKDITLPSTIESIGSNAFSSANGYGASSTQYESYVKSVTILATTPPIAGVEIFGYTFSGSIIVPNGCGEAYKAAEGWSTYADYITEEG